jgi:starvation-inducible DNA-binding protein
MEKRFYTWSYPPIKLSNPPGGEIQHDARGNPTGLLIARPNATILYATLAKGPKLPLEHQMNSTRHFMCELNRLGLTSIIDAGGGFQNYPEDYAVIDELHRMAYQGESFMGRYGKKAAERTPPIRKKMNLRNIRRHRYQFCRSGRRRNILAATERRWILARRRGRACRWNSICIMRNEGSRVAPTQGIRISPAVKQRQIGMPDFGEAAVTASLFEQTKMKGHHHMKRSNNEIEQANTLYETENDIPHQRRAALCELMNQRLADAIDLQTQMKQAHWNVKGPNFIGLHELFDQIDEAVESYVDLIAERIVQLGGIAEGTARSAAARSRLDEYPLDIANGSAHVEAVSRALSTFGEEARKSIDETDGLGDADTADIFTEVSRGIDKWLWFVEAHSQADK